MQAFKSAVLSFLFTCACLVSLGDFARAQSPAACQFAGSFTSTGTTTQYDNRRLGCYQWRFSYTNTGFTVVSIKVEQAPDVSGTPGTWAAFTGATVVTDGTNPSTSTNAGIIAIHSAAAWVRVNLSTATGSGNIIFQMWGANSTSNVASLNASSFVASVTATAPITSTGGNNPVIACPTCSTATAVTAVTATSPVVSTGGTTPVISCPTCSTATPVTSVSASAPITSTGGTTPVISATYQGNGAKVQASTGTTTTDHCVKFDANGNTVDAGAACGVGGGTVTAVTATAPLTSSGGTTPVISATYQGNGTKIQASTGSTTTNDCVKFDANGNTVDAGAACGTGGGSSTGVLGVNYVVTKETRSATSYSALTTADSVTFSCAATCNVAATYLAQFDNETNSTPYSCINDIFLDGVQKTTSQGVVVPGNVAFSYTFTTSAQVALASVASGSHTIAMQYKSGTAGDGCGWQGRLLTVLQTP